MRPVMQTEGVVTLKTLIALVDPLNHTLTTHKITLMAEQLLEQGAVDLLNSLEQAASQHGHILIARTLRDVTDRRPRQIARQLQDIVQTVAEIEQCGTFSDIKQMEGMVESVLSDLVEHLTLRELIVQLALLGGRQKVERVIGTLEKRCGQLALPYFEQCEVKELFDSVSGYIHPLVGQMMPLIALSAQEKGFHTLALHALQHPTLAYTPMHTKLITVLAPTLTEKQRNELIRELGADAASLRSQVEEAKETAHIDLALLELEDTVARSLDCLSLCMSSLSLNEAYQEQLLAYIKYFSC